MASERERAATPEDLTRLFVERANARDSDGLAALYEPDAVLAYPPGQTTRGATAIQSFYEAMVGMELTFEPEQPLPTITSGDIALTSTHRRDGAGIRVQVARRQPDGSWLRIIDMPEPPEPETRSSSTNATRPTSGVVERTDFVSVFTRDIQRAREFYADTLGLEIESESESDMEFRCGQVTLDVFDPSSIGQEFTVSPAGLALRVHDVDVVRAELEAKGVPFDGDTIATGVCRMAFFKDPDGNALLLHRRFDA